MILGKFLRYYPSDEKRIADAVIINEITGLEVIFLKDKDGNDWYDVLNEFSSHTMKVAFDDDNIIRYCSVDASTLNPVDMTVAEVNTSDVPAGFDASGEWVFNGEVIIPRQPNENELIMKAEVKKQAFLKEANENIAPLQDAYDLGMATEQENQLLLIWKKYRVFVSRVDTSKPEWPEKPE